MAYATVEQYEARFGHVDDTDLLGECLDDATEAINAALESAGIDYDDPSEAFESRLMRVCRSVANRLMPFETSAPAGATQVSMTAGPYQQSFSLPQSYGTAKLLPSEMKMLGIGGRLGVARPSYGKLEVCDD